MSCSSSCSSICIFIFLLTFILQNHSTISSPTPSFFQHHYSRRILLQPLLHSLPISPSSPSPSPSLQPKHHHRRKHKHSNSSKSPATSGNNFFPSYPSLPPSPPSATNSLPTFPANVSSLTLRHSSSSKPSHKLVAIVVPLSLLFAALIAVAAVFLILRRRRQLRNLNSKIPRSDGIRLFPSNAPVSDSKSPPPSSPPPPEFQYFNTLARSGKSINVGSSSSRSGYLKLDSPELRPLPPLPKQNISGQQSYYNNTFEFEEEQFFSPRASSGSPDPEVLSSSSLTRTENFRNRSRSLNSGISSYPTSKSISPSVASNLSLRSLSEKSPDSLVNFPGPLRPVPLSPPRGQKVLSPSPPSSPPERNSGDWDTQNSLEKLSDGDVDVQVNFPPAPPPWPPTKFWEMQPQSQGFGKSGSRVSPLMPSVESQNAGDNMEIGGRSDEAVKRKLKPLHWDKVKASSDREMVWDQLKSSSFQLNEELIETLFMVNSSNLVANDDKISRPLFPRTNKENHVLDPKKSQNIAILLRARNVTIDEVCEALLEGNTDTLGTELLDSLLKMAPTKEEERKLKEFEDSSPFKLGPAEKFLKEILDIPFAFQRVNAMLYIANFDSEVEYLKRSFETLEAACEELRNSRMFMKLLEAVLKTGNRMNVGTNRGDAHAFKLDTLLKLVDVKGTDKKTSLLHFVVQEIIRAEGFRLSGDQGTTAEMNGQSALRNDVEYRKLGLQVVSSLSGELTNVKKSAAMDSDILNTEILKLSTGINRIVEVIKLNDEITLSENSRKFSQSMNEFLKRAEEEIVKIQAQENVALSMVKEITRYFHGNSAKEEAHPFRIFVVVRDFLSILDQVCKEVWKINERTILSSVHQFPLPINASLPPVFPGLNRLQQLSFSDDESSSSSS